MARANPGLLAYQRADGTEEHVALRNAVTTLGRSDTCSLAFPLTTVSRLHAKIEQEHDRYILSDAGSANGTFINGKRINAHHVLTTGDEIWLGSNAATLVFSDPEETLMVAVGSIPAPLFIDPNARTVTVYGAAVPLSPLEYGLLVFLAQHRGKVRSREACFLAVWGQPYDPATCEDAFNACIAKLRRNLRATAESIGQEPPQITTVQRAGFRLDTEVAFAPQTNPIATIPASGA